MLRIYAIDEIIAEAYSDATTYIYRSGMSEMKYGDRLWRNALQYGNIFSDDRLKSLYASGLLSAIQVQMHHHWTTHPKLSFMDFTRYAEGCGKAQNRSKKYLPLPRGRKKSLLRGQRSSRDLLLIGSSSESRVG